MEIIRKFYITIAIVAIMAILANGLVGITVRVLEAKVGIECEMYRYHALIEEVRSEYLDND